MNHANAKPLPSTVTDAPLKISINGTHVDYENKDETLLECLEKSGHEVHYHCRDGYCGACRITLNKGEVDYFNGEPLAYVGKDEILPCCCKPIGDIDITVI